MGCPILTSDSKERHRFISMDKGAMVIKKTFHQQKMYRSIVEILSGVNSIRTLDLLLEQF